MQQPSDLAEDKTDKVVNCTSRINDTNCSGARPLALTGSERRLRVVVGLRGGGLLSEEGGGGEIC